MADAQKVEIGFEGGQVVSVRLNDDELKDLRKQVEKGGWHDVKTEDGVARRLPRQGRLPADRLGRAPGRLRLRADARPHAARRSPRLATLGAALWWRKNPSACPYGQRFWVEAPHPIITRERLR